MGLKINVPKDNFLTALGFLQNVTGKKGTLAILANVLIVTGNDSIEVVGTDLEVGIKSILPAEIKSPGSITLPGKILYEIVREAGSETLSLEETDNSWVNITSGSSVYNLAGTSAEEFPDFPEYDDKNMANVSGKLLKELIDKTIFSVAHERESNFTLTGILFEKEKKDNKVVLRMISSDGHRLSIMENEVNDEVNNINFNENVIIPRKGVLDIKKICESFDDIYLGVEKKQIVIQTKNSISVIRLMNGEFPDYKSILSVVNREKRIEINKKFFLDALKRTSLFTEDTFNAIQLDISKNKLILSSQNMDYGNATDKLDIKYEGEKFTIGFNCKYFIDTLLAMSSETIKLCISSNQNPCLVEGDDDAGFVSIIMPMKI